MYEQSYQFTFEAAHDLAENVKYARLWNAAHEGQHVGRDHVVLDGDVIELHE